MIRCHCKLIETLNNFTRERIKPKARSSFTRVSVTFFPAVPKFTTFISYFDKRYKFWPNFFNETTEVLLCFHARALNASYCARPIVWLKSLLQLTIFDSYFISFKWLPFDFFLFFNTRLFQGWIHT